MHLMFYKYQDEIDEFYDKACELHNSTLDLTMKTLFVQPIGHTLEVKTSAGDTFKITDGETFPNIRYNTPKEKITLRIETQTVFRESHYLDVHKDEEGYHALDGVFYSLENVENYIHNMIDEEPETFVSMQDFDSIDLDEITSIRGITRL